MRIVIFTDANNATVTGMIRETVRICDARPDLELGGFVTSRPEAFRSSRRRDGVRRLRRLAVAAANPGARAGSLARARIDLFALARHRGVPVLVPPAGNPNHPDFPAELQARIGPDVALSCYCRTIWRAALLDALPQAVNYHDGLLPDYKGVAATSFSIYEGQPRSGFTFHHMTVGIDAGPILVQGAVALDERSTFGEVDRRKRLAAVAALPQVLDRVTAHDPGQPQERDGSYHSGKEYRALTRVGRPDALTADEVLLRVRAFGRIDVEIDGSVWPITRVRAAPSGRRVRGPCVTTVDGRRLVVDRVRGLPVRFARPSVAGGGRAQ